MQVEERSWFSAALGSYGYILRDPSLDRLLAASTDILAQTGTGG